MEDSSAFYAEYIVKRVGDDMYGREENIKTVTRSEWHGGSVKPDSVEAQGTITYPAGTKFEQSEFARNIDETIHYEYNDKGQLAGGSGTDQFSGHISTTAGTIPYSGSATPTFKVKNGQLLCTKRTETTNYYYNGKYYAETVAVNTLHYDYLGGKWIVVSETVKTTTSYADGSKRDSVIVILWQRTEYGLITGKSGSGNITGTEVMNGKQVSYTGSVTLDYGFDLKISWYKVRYREGRSAQIRLPERLPFEVMFIDDYILRPAYGTDWNL